MWEWLWNWAVSRGWENFEECDGEPDLPRIMECLWKPGLKERLRKPGTWYWKPERWESLYIVAERLMQLSPSAACGAQPVSRRVGCTAKEISKQSYGNTTWFLLTAYSKVWEEISKLSKELSNRKEPVLDDLKIPSLSRWQKMLKVRIPFLIFFFSWQESMH